IELEKRRTDFITMTTHELRTPLTSILGYVDLIEKHHENLDKNSMELSLRNIRKNAQRLERLSSSTTELALKGKDMFKLDIQPVDFDKFLESKIEDYSNLLGSQFEYENMKSDSVPLIVECDRDRISQVLDNLIDNARKQTSQNERKIILRLSISSTTLRFHVIDNGAGIELENQKLIFDQFTSLPTKFSVKGTGIGLYLSRFIMESHNGTLTVESDGLDKGATFILELPLKADLPDTHINDST
ncbi:MAG: sensor histidine kinase, partial [Promethearchaeota archaeon]